MPTHSAPRTPLPGVPPQMTGWMGRLLSWPWSAVGTVVVVAGTLLLTWARLFLGVDLTDEAFYVALPYRFWQGDIPLRDEHNLAQMAGVLTLPLVRLFAWINGGTESIVLYMRHMHLLFTIGLGTGVFLILRRTLNWRNAALTSALCLVFVPFNIHGLSYNTLGSGFLTLGLFFGFAGVLTREESNRAGIHWFAAGLCQAIAVVVYPTMIAGIVVFAGVACLAPRVRARRNEQLLYLAGAALASIFPVWLVLQAGIENIRHIAVYLSGFTTQGGGIGKLATVAANFWLVAPGVKLLAGASIVVVIWHLLKPRLLLPLLPLLPLLIGVYCLVPNGTDSLYAIVVLCLTGPLAYGFVRHIPAAGGLMALVWIPSTATGIVTAWSSGNGAVNGSIGMFPGALAALALIQLALHDRTVAGWRHSFRSSVAYAAPILPLIALLAGGYADVYGEGVGPDKLTHRVNDGPFRGLMTTAQKHASMGHLSRTLLPHVRADDRVLVFDGPPAGYLLIGARPLVNSVWLAPASPEAVRQSTLTYWERHGRPSIVLLNRATAAGNDPLMLELDSLPFTTIARSGEFVLRRYR